MLIDLTLIEEAIVLEISKELLKKDVLIHLSESDAIKSMYPTLGKFEITGNQFGLGGCFLKQAEDHTHLIYAALVPALGSNSLRQILLTHHLISRYVIEAMDINGASLKNNEWRDQSFSINALSGELNGNYNLSGRVYPWFIKTIGSLSATRLQKINRYVRAQLSTNGSIIDYEQIKITNSSFMLQIGNNGRIEWSGKNGQNSFNSYNLTNPIDQEKAFIAIISINTWLRNINLMEKQK